MASMQSSHICHPYRLLRPQAVRMALCGSAPTAVPAAVTAPSPVHSHDRRGRLPHGAGPLQARAAARRGGHGHGGSGAAAPRGGGAAAVPTLLRLAVGDVSEGLEAPVQAFYLISLLGLLSVGAFLVVRQVLIRRELEEAAKVLGDRVRSGLATSEDYFELGVILLRKKLFTQATKNLEKALKGWEGEAEELAQVHNALGYAYFNMEKTAEAVRQYRAAVELQPGYITAWNNLGDAYERLKQYAPALDAYREVLAYAPDNQVARARADFCKTRLDRASGANV